MAHQRKGRAAAVTGKPRGGVSPNINPKRLDHVEKLLSQLWPHSRIIRVLAEEWDCSTRTVENYIRRVYDRAQAEAEEMRALRREELRLAIREHFRAAVAKEEFSAAGPDLDRLAKLDGLYADKYEISGPGGAPLTVDMTAAVDALSRQVVAATASRKKTTEDSDT